MKVDMGKIPIRISLDTPAVGDVYRAKGGSRGRTKFFVVVAIVGEMAHAFGIDAEGAIVSTTSYGAHVFASRDIVGRVEELADLSLNIRWEAL